MDTQMLDDVSREASPVSMIDRDQIHILENAHEKDVQPRDSETCNPDAKELRHLMPSMSEDHDTTQRNPPANSTSLLKDDRNRSAFSRIFAKWSHKENSLNAPSEPGDTLGWPKTGSHVTDHVQGLGWWIIFGFLDIVVLLLPLAFLTLAIVAASLDRHLVADYKTTGDIVERAMKLAPTIWPITFAAVTARALKLIARLRLERGSSIGTLEQLVGSHTFFSTLETQALLRSFRPLSIALCVLWCLSPLGGQSALRLMSISHSITYSAKAITYADTNQSSTIPGLYDNIGDLLSITWINLIEGFFITSMISINHTRNKPVDLWGNLKIPKFETLNTNEDERGWRSVPKENVEFSAAVGIPFLDIPEKGSVGFSIESSYMLWECDGISYESYDGWTQNLINPITAVNSTSSMNGATISTGLAYFQPSSDTTPIVTSFLLDNSTNSLGHDGLQLNPRRILFGSRNSRGVTLAHMNVTQTRVESQIMCEDGACIVTQMRLSRQDQTPSTTTALNFYGNNALFESFSRAGTFDLAATDNTFIGTPDVSWTECGQAGMSENYIQTLIYTPPIIQFANLSNVTTQQFGVRLGFLFNTYFHISQMSSTIVGDGSLWSVKIWPDSFSIMDSYIGSYTSSRGNYYDLSARNATATVINQDPDRYYVNRGWLAALFISSIILFLLAVLGTVAKYFCRAPDIMGYVSTMTRDNFFCPIDPQGSALDGLDRARFLKKTKIKISDVQSDDSIGRIAVSWTSGNDEKVLSGERLTKRKLYI